MWFCVGDSDKVTTMEITWDNQNNNGYPTHWLWFQVYCSLETSYNQLGLWRLCIPTCVNSCSDYVWLSDIALTALTLECPQYLFPSPWTWLMKSQVHHSSSHVFITWVLSPVLMGQVYKITPCSPCEILGESAPNLTTIDFLTEKATCLAHVFGYPQPQYILTWMPNKPRVASRNLMCFLSLTPFHC